MNRATRTLLGFSVLASLAGCASQPASDVPAPPTAQAGEAGDVAKAPTIALPDYAGGAGGGHTHPAGQADHAHPAGGSVVHDHAQHQYFEDPTPTGAATPVVAQDAVSFRTQVVPVLRQHCAGCHTAGTSGAHALTMFDAEGAPQHRPVKAQFGRLLIELQAGRMPKGQPYSLTSEEFTLLDMWGAAEMPDN